MTLDQAVISAKQFQHSKDFLQKIEDDTRNYTRLQAIVGTALVGIIIDFEWMKSQQLLEWSRDIFLAAIRSSESSIYANSSSSIKVYAEQGLALLVVHNLADTEVRNQILQFIGDSSKRFANSGESAHSEEAVKAIFGKLENAWDIDPVLCWNALSLCLSLSTIPRKLCNGTRIGKYGTSYKELKIWENNIIQNHLDNLVKNKIPELPRISLERNIVFDHDLTQYGLYALPLSRLCQDLKTKDKFLQLCDDLIARTISENLPVDGNRHSQSDELNRFVFGWAAYLANSLSFDEIRHHILIPLQDNWSEASGLTANFLNGYISAQIAYIQRPSDQSLKIWKELCLWILNSPAIEGKASNAEFVRDTAEVLQLIIFTEHGLPRIKADWQHAHLFTDVFDKWVNVVGHFPHAYSHLLTMLNGIGWQFAPETTLNWITQCARANVNNDLWNEKLENGRKTAELLNRIWIKFEKQIWKNSNSRQHYSEIVDSLVVVGIPLASVLQEKLERRKHD
jgi:hypothetical protein